MDINLKTIKTDGSDNSSTLMSMRNARAGSNKPHYRLIFPKGTEVSYLNNRWLTGIQSYEILGNGLKFSSLYTGNDEALKRAFWTGELLQTNVLEYTGTKLYTKADQLAEIKAGDIQVTRIGKDQKLSKDSRTIIYGGNYFNGGYPPPCFMEKKQVMNLSGNVITLDSPLEKNYPADVWDNPLTDGGGSGKPRIINVDHWARFARFTDCVITGNFAPSAERVELINCSAQPGFYWPSECGDIYCKRSVFGPNEFDKLFNTWFGDEVIFNGSANGGGSGDKITLINSTAYGPVRFNPRYLELRNNRIICIPDPRVNVDEWIPSLADYPARNPVRQCIIQNLTFDSRTPSKADHHIGMFPVGDAQSSIQIEKTNGNSILTKDFEKVKQLEPGSSIFAEDGTDGGEITKISFDGENHVISGKWKNTPKGIWKWSYCKSVIDLGGHKVLDGKQLWGGNSLRWKGNTGDQIMKLDESDFTEKTRTIDMYCFIEWIKVEGSGIEIQNVDPFEDIPLNFEGRKWVKQIYLIGKPGKINVFIKLNKY